MKLTTLRLTLLLIGTATACREASQSWYVRSYQDGGATHQQFKIVHEGVEYDVICDPYMSHTPLCVSDMRALVGHSVPNGDVYKFSETTKRQMAMFGRDVIAVHAPGKDATYYLNVIGVQAVETN